MEHETNGYAKRLKDVLIRFFDTIKPSLLAVLFGLLIGLIILLIFDYRDAFPALFTLLGGGFNAGFSGLGDTLYKAAPIILTGLAVAFAFKTGLFNIGASGQMMLGAYVAIHVGVRWSIPAPWHWIIALVMAMIAGLLWGAIPGLLKAISNVHEVVTSIMMNYIAGHLLIFLIKSNVYNFNRARSITIRRTAQLPSFGQLFADSQANIGILIAIAMTIIGHIVIHKTTLGYELRASGFSVHGSEYAGMNTKRNIVAAMSISGMFSGLAGGIAYLVYGKTIGTSFEIFGEGFDGISVALLGLGEPIGALFAGLFLSHLRMGGNYMQIYAFEPEIIDIIVAVIIYVTAISAALQSVLTKRKKRIKGWLKIGKEEEEID
ncbi:MAG: ABC transporter permease [Acholeplasmataceae bacterium]